MPKSTSPKSQSSPSLKLVRASQKCTIYCLIKLKKISKMLFGLACQNVFLVQTDVKLCRFLHELLLDWPLNLGALYDKDKAKILLIAFCRKQSIIHYWKFNHCNLLDLVVCFNNWSNLNRDMSNNTKLSK